jgi:hypothetical protein
MCTHFIRCWVAERNHIREVITTNRLNHAAFERLKEEKVVVEAKLNSLEVVYSMLKEQIQDVVL